MVPKWCEPTPGACRLPGGLWLGSWIALRYALATLASLCAGCLHSRTAPFREIWRTGPAHSFRDPVLTAWREPCTVGLSLEILMLTTSQRGVGFITWASDSADVGSLVSSPDSGPAGRLFPVTCRLPVGSDVVFSSVRVVPG